MKHFLRPRGAAASPPADATSRTVANGSRAYQTGQDLSPTTLPGFLFRPSVVTDYIPTSVATGDFNHDGIDDIVELVEPQTGLDIDVPLQYAIYLGQPDGSFKLTNTYQPYAGFTVIYTLNSSNGVTLADFNGDGNLDIAVFQSQTRPQNGGNPDLAHTFLEIMEGNGDGTFTPTYTIFDFGQLLVPQLAADLTGDGKADLVELSAVNGSFHVMPATVGPALQVRLVTTPIVGSSGNAQVSLAAASSSDTAVQIAASDPAISIPASVTIPAGSVSQNVPFQIGSGFNSQRVFTINAALGAQTATAYGWQAGSSLAEGFTLYLGNSSQAAYVAQPTPDYAVSVYSINNYSTTSAPRLRSSRRPASPAASRLALRRSLWDSPPISLSVSIRRAAPAAMSASSV